MTNKCPTDPTAQLLASQPLANLPLTAEAQRTIQREKWPGGAQCNLLTHRTLKKRWLFTSLCLRGFVSPPALTATHCPSQMVFLRISDGCLVLRPPLL